jgi:hypothetical protein
MVGDSTAASLKVSSVCCTFLVPVVIPPYLDLESLQMLNQKSTGAGDHLGR